MIPSVFFRSCVLVMWARGDSPAVAASILGDSLDAAEHPGLSMTLCTGLHPDHQFVWHCRKGFAGFQLLGGEPLSQCCSGCEEQGLAATVCLPGSRALLDSPFTQAHPVLLVPSQVFHHRKRVLLLASADLTVTEFILSSDLTSPFLKPAVILP